MKISCICLLLLGFFTGTTHAKEVVLVWEQNQETDISYYTIYRAERIADHSTAWAVISTVSAEITTYTDTVDTKNYAWMVTASDTAGNVSFPSNMVELYDKTPPRPPIDFKKAVSENNK